jgi:hypothetical protein
MCFARVVESLPIAPQLSPFGGPPNGLELSCPAEAGSSSLLYGTRAGQARSNQGPARRVSFSELLGDERNRVLGLRRPEA